MIESQRSELAQSALQSPTASAVEASTSATPAVGGNSGMGMHEGINASSGSYELVFAAVILGLVGFGLDTWFGTRPLLTIILSCVGFLGAAVSIFYRYRYAMAAQTAARQERAA